jgi:nucleoside-diphosphate-sugar epimerase
MAAAAVAACRTAQVARLVWLSSASVHGQAPAPGTDETTPLRDDLPFPYAVAKIRAERTLAAARDVPSVRLRPGIVHGPRSRWIADAAEQVRRGTAWWIEGGCGVCHAIYVDNVLEAARLACTVPGAVGEAFLIGDAEEVKWRDFLVPIAVACGGGEHSFREIAVKDLPPHETPAPLQRLMAIPAIRRAALHVPDRAKRLVKSLAGSWPEPGLPPSAWSLADPPAPRLTAELGELMQCRWRLPHTKAAHLLGYTPGVPFAEGLRRSLAWLEWAR